MEAWNVTLDDLLYLNRHYNNNNNNKKEDICFRSLQESVGFILILFVFILNIQFLVILGITDL